MMVSPKAAEAAGDKFGLQPVCAGPYKFVERVQQDRIVVEKFADYWNKDQVFIDKITYLPIVDATVRLANLRSGGLDLIERVLATDIKTVRDDPKLKLSKAVSLGYFGLTDQRRQRAQGRQPAGQGRRACARPSSSRSTATRINQVVFNGEFVPGNQWVNPQNPYYQEKFPVPKRDVAKAKALLKEAGVTGPITLDFMVPNGAGDARRRRGRAVDGRPRPASTSRSASPSSPPRSRQAEDGDFQLYLIGWSGRIDPDGNSYSSRSAARRRTRAATATRRSTRCTQRGARRRATRPSARRSTRRSPPSSCRTAAIIYLYHPQYLIAHTDKLEGFKPMPDGLIRVIGVKLK